MECQPAQQSEENPFVPPSRGGTGNGREQSSRWLLWRGADGRWWRGYGWRARAASARRGRPTLAPLPCFCPPISHISTNMGWRISRKNGVGKAGGATGSSSLCVRVMGLGTTQRSGDPVTPQSTKTSETGAGRCVQTAHLLTRPHKTQLPALRSVK